MKLTDEQVALARDSLGADAVGFILTESPRRVETSFIRSLPGTSALKIGVVRLGAGEDIPSDIAELLREGSLDALQFHGLETAADLRRWMDYGFKALSPANSAEVEAWDGAWPPRQLLDAFVPGQSGGTGKRVDEALLEALGSRPLWLAGGLNPDNIGGVVRRWKPELVDASSGLESSPGTKDHDKMRRYFEEIIHAVE